MGTTQLLSSIVLAELLLSTVSGAQAPAVQNATPAGSPDISMDIPNVDVKIVPQKSWQTSRAALAELRRKFSRVIRDEIRAAARAWDRQMKSVKGGTSAEQLGVFTNSSPSAFGGHPQPARFQEVVPFALNGDTEERLEIGKAKSAEVQQEQLNTARAVQGGTFYGATQGAMPIQYSEAFAKPMGQQENIKLISGEEISGRLTKDETGGSKLMLRNGPILLPDTFDEIT